MRLSEKSIELNFCHQMSKVLGEPIWWFGTTQAQEREAGWDVAGKVHGYWMRFQLKASNEVLRTGARRFRGHHHQLVELHDRALNPLSVLYVLPTIGTTAELMAVRFDLLPRLRFLDVYAVPGAIAPPTTPSGALRKSGLHYFDLHPTLHAVTIHSDPLEVGTMGVDDLGAGAGDLRNTADRRRVGPDLEDGVGSAREFLLGGRNRVAAFLPSA